MAIFSNYLMQSLIMIGIFYGARGDFGFGFGGHFGDDPHAGPHADHRLPSGLGNRRSAQSEPRQRASLWPLLSGAGAARPYARALDADPVYAIPTTA